MRSILTILFVLVLALSAVSNAWSLGAPNYYPDGSHPRLYLSSAVMSDLQTLKESNTSEYQALINWCNAYAGANVTSGYQGSEWVKFATTFGLCYQMTGTETYAAESAIYIEALLDDTVVTNNGVIGDNGGGAVSIQTDSGYTARLIGVGVPLARDWIDGSAALTESLKQRITARMNDWISWYITSGYQRTTPKDNYFGGYFEMVYTTAIALYGDTGYQSSWLTLSRSLWTTYVLPIINGGEFDPADSMEGWSYFPHHALSYIKYPVLSEMAQGYDDWASIGDWHTDILNTVVQMLRPDRMTMFDDGVWDSTAKSGVSDSRNLINFIGTFTPLTETKKGIARWYTANLGAERSSVTALPGFLYSRPSDATITPDTSNMGGLTYQTKGNVISRSDTWTNTNATWYSVTAWNGDLSEGGRSAGELKIWSRGEYLLPDGTYSSYDGKYSNTLTATGPHRYSPFQDWDSANISTTVEDGGSYTLTNVDGLEDVYDTLHYGTTLSQYHRSILHIKPDIFIISDNAQAVTTSTIGRRWHFFANPITTSNTARANMTTADIAMWTDGTVSTTSGPNTGYPYREGTYTVDVSGDGLTVFEVGDSGFTPHLISPLSLSDSEGVQITSVDERESWTVIFSSRGATTIDFNLSADSQAINPSDILIVGLAAGDSYKMIFPENHNVSQAYHLEKIDGSYAGAKFIVNNNGSLYLRSSIAPLLR